MSIDKLHIKNSLLIALRDGDESAFNSIYECLYTRLYHFVRNSIQNSEDAEEIVQEVFVKIWNERKNIDLNKSFEAFVFTICRNQIKDFLRKVLSQKKYIESVIANYSFENNELEDIVNFRETDKVLKKLIGLLPERRRKAFILSRFQGKTYREISLLMNVSENTVDTHIRKSLAFIKEGLVRFSSILFFL